MSENLGNVLKPSQPDFGYEDIITFEDEEKKEVKPKGWGRFLEIINRYPKQEKLHNLIDELKEEKQLQVKKRK